jgi:hypothetical protein
MKKFRVIVLLVIFIYLVLPFAAGALNSGDRRGPLIYPRSYHELAFRIAYHLVRKSEPAVPFRKPRELFYGVSNPFDG